MNIKRIQHLMHEEGLSSELQVAAIKTAKEFEGVADLLQMWCDEEDPIEKALLLSDIQQLIADCELYFYQQL